MRLIEGTRLQSRNLCNRILAIGLVALLLLLDLTPAFNMVNYDLLTHYFAEIRVHKWLGSGLLHFSMVRNRE